MTNKTQGNLMEILAGTIRGVLDGDISPSQANSVNGAASQMIKVAKLKIEHGNSIIDGVVIPSTNLVTSDDDVVKGIHDYVASNGESEFKDVAASLGVTWQRVESLSNHNWFVRTGRSVSLKP